MLHPVGPPQGQVFYSGWDSSECTPRKVSDLVVTKFIPLVDDGQRRMTGYTQNPQFASQGFWYQNANFKALQEIEKEPKARLTHFRKNGNFYHGIPPRGFYHLAEPDPDKSISGKKVCGYALKEEISASEGLQSAKESFSFIDCSILTQIALYDVFLEIAGTERFDEYFDAKREHSLGLVPEYATSFCDFLSPVTIDSVRDIKKGDIVYFRNVPAYGFKHTHGEAQGYRCICIEAGEEPKFATFGHSAEGFTKDQMYTILVDDLNEEPLPYGSIVTEEFEEKMEKNAIQVTASLNGVSEETVKKKIEDEKNLTISKESIEAFHRIDPSLAGLTPEVLRVNVTKVRDRLLKPGKGNTQQRQLSRNKKQIRAKAK